MGTPGFMAPEQASGKSDVTTAADIYSLGAILYWIIAGRTPHQGETQLETIMKTIQQDPESIRSHRSDADRGLDLICLKALDIEPDSRYHSAEDLANDLRAWLAGEPLSVRAPTLFEQASLWLRKNFRSLSIGTTTGAVCGGLIGLNILIIICHETLADEGYFQQLGDSHEYWIAKYFHWTKDLPSALVYTLGPAIVWLTVLFGYLNIRLLKPEKREVIFAVAAVAALIAGIVSFTVSLGWSPIVRKGINVGVHDIELLSDSFWLETDEERTMAHQALFQRYPGLQQVDVKQRGALIKSKILRDQSSGIPRGMWEGIGITLCLSVVPLFLSTVFSGMIWRRGARGFAHFGKTIEIAIYSALALLIGLKFFSPQVGFSPGVLIQLITLCGLGYGIFFAFRDSRWYWRILGFIVVHVVFFGNFIESARIASASRFAATAKSPAEFKRAANYIERQHFQSNAPYNRFQLAILYAYLGQDQLYAKQCEHLLAEFENMHRPEVAERAAKVFFLKPNLHTDLSQPHELARAASVLSHSSQLGHWFSFCRALSELRQGNAEATLQWNQSCREQFDFSATDRHAVDRLSLCLGASTYAVDALAYDELGDVVAARAALQTAHAHTPQDVDRDGVWENRLILEILLQEADGKFEMP